MRVEAFVKNGSAEEGRPSTEIVGQTGRRQVSTSYIDRILKELDDAPHGESGKILRREGLYSKQVAKWRKQRASSVTTKRWRKSEASVDLKKPRHWRKYSPVKHTSIDHRRRS